MPLVGFECPSWTPTAGEQHTLDHCLGVCPHPCAAAPLLASIYEANRSNYHQGSYISASMLAGDNCPRKTQWERFEPYFENVRRLYWPFRGTIVHAMLEQQAEEIAKYGWMQELKLSTTLEFPERQQPVFDATGAVVGQLDQPLVITLNGTTDLLNAHQRVIGDMKSMKCEAASDVIKDGKLKAEWAMQLNIYAWLTSRTVITDAMRALWASNGLPNLPGECLPYPERLFIQVISMMEMPMTGSAYSPQRDPTVYQIPALEVWSAERTEAFVRSRALLWYDTLVLREPQPVVPANKQWQCGSCCFNGERIAGERCHPKAELQQLQRAKVLQGGGHKAPAPPVTYVPFTLE